MPSDLSAASRINYADYLSSEARRRVRSPLKSLRPYTEVPGMISFGGGFPHPSTWPVNGITLSVPFSGTSVFVPGYQCSEPEKMLPLEKFTPVDKGEALAPNLAVELQYGKTFGAPHFLHWIKEHVKRVHNPPYAGWEVHTTAGNTDGVDGLLRVLFDRGDSVLVEEFAFPGALQALKSQAIECVGVPMDADGIIPEELDKVVAEWDERVREARKPRAIFMVPTCSNPTGYTAPEARRRALYAVCQKHGLLIIEDDPYCFLQIRPNGANSSIVPSFLSIDTDGRVLRLDSFSKIVAPGSRCGWLTGPSEIVTRVMHRSEASTGMPSGFTVAAITAVIRAWGGHDGFEQRYLPHISGVYSERSLAMISFLEANLPREAAEWPAPSGGMFLWVRLRVETHPDFELGAREPEQIAEELFKAAIGELVLAAPSSFFKAPGGRKWTKEEEAKRIFLRVCYATPTMEQLEEGTRRLGRALRTSWRLPLNE